MTPGVLIRDPFTGKLLRDKATGKLLRVPPDGDVSCLCVCAPGCNDTVSCVSITFSSVMISKTGSQCETFSFTADGEYKLLPRNLDGTPSSTVWSGCFDGPIVSCNDNPGCGHTGLIRSAANLFILAICPNAKAPDEPADGSYDVSLIAGDVGVGGVSEGCCQTPMLFLNLKPGIPVVIGPITDPDATFTGTVTLNQILPADPPPRTCTGTEPTDCVVCGQEPPCDRCVGGGPGSTCPSPLPAFVTINPFSFPFGMALCPIDGCLDDCTIPATVDCLFDSGTCADGNAQYIGLVNLPGSGPCIKFVCRFDGSDWIVEAFDVRCSQSTLMWRGFWIERLDSPHTAPAGTYRQECLGYCDNVANPLLCEVFVTETTSCDCGTATGLPTTRTVVITGSPNACLNGTWTLDNGPNSAGPFCVYGTGTPCGGFGSALTLRWGDGSIGNPGPWNILSFSSDPAIDMAGGISCDPVGATATATDGTVLTVTA